MAVGDDPDRRGDGARRQWAVADFAIRGRLHGRRHMDYPGAGMSAAEIAKALHGYRAGQWWRCRCPAHQGRSASLALRDGNSRLLVKCWAGCDPRDVLA